MFSQSTIIPRSIGCTKERTSRLVCACDPTKESLRSDSSAPITAWKMERGESSPENPALIDPEPLSTTTTSLLLINAEALDKGSI